jgi:hypothetical protein
MSNLAYSIYLHGHRIHSLSEHSIEGDNQSRDSHGRSRIVLLIGRGCRDIESPALRDACRNLTESLSGTLHINHYHHLRSISHAIVHFNSSAQKLIQPRPSLTLTSQWSTARSNRSHSTRSSKLVCRHAPHRLKHAANNIQGRKQRRHEQLAQDIFGKNRRQSAPAAGNTRNAPLGGSLASRVGVNKVYTSILQAGDHFL